MAAHRSGSESAVAAGYAADQLDLLDRLGWKRRLFPGWAAPAPPLRGLTVRLFDGFGNVLGEAPVQAGQVVFEGVHIVRPVTSFAAVLDGHQMLVRSIPAPIHLMPYDTLAIPVTLE